MKRAKLNNLLSAFGLLSGLAGAPAWGAEPPSFCRQALTARQIDAEIQSLSKRLARAAEITDLSQKSKALQVIDRQIHDLESVFGETIRKRIALLAEGIQKTRADQLALQESQLAESRKSETDALLVWNKRIEIPHLSGKLHRSVVIAPKTGKLLTIESDHLVISELSNLNQAPNNVRVAHLRVGDDIFLSPDETNLVVKMSSSPTNGSQYKKISLDGDAIEALGSNSNQSSVAAGFFLDGTMLQYSKAKFQTQAPGKIKKSVPGLSYFKELQEILPLPDQRYALLKGRTMNIEGVFDRKENKIISFAESNTRATPPVGRWPVFDRFHNRLYFTDSGHLQNKVQVMDLATGAWGLSKIEGRWREVWGSGDHTKIIAIRNAEFDATGAVSDTVIIFDLKTEKEIKIPDSPEKWGQIAVRDTQPGGPLVLLENVLSNEPRTSEFFLLNSTSGEMAEVQGLKDTEVTWARIKPDGKSILFQWRSDGRMYELK